MITKTLSKEELELRIERGLTKLVIPHKDNYITFVYTGEGSDTYQNVFSEILKRNLRPVTGEETASLLYSVYCDEKFGNEPEAKGIKEIMRNSWLFVANRNLWTSKGVYVAYDNKGVGRSENLQINDLEKLLKGAKEVNGVRFSKNSKVRFAPKDTYKLKYSSPEELGENGFVIASYGTEGAEQLAKISTKFSNKSYIHGLNILEGNANELRCSALGGCGGDGLYIDGDSLGDYGDGHVFGGIEIK